MSSCGSCARIQRTVLCNGLRIWHGLSDCVSQTTRSFKSFPGHKKRRLEKIKRVNRSRAFENIFRAEKHLRRLLLLKNTLAKHPHHIVKANDLGKQLDAQGLMHCTKALRLLRRYPCIFKVSEDPTLCKEASVQFTERALSLIKKEDELQKWYEPFLVEKVTKLLMMSRDRKLRLNHICMLERELGLPHDFQTRIVYEYPHRFKVSERKDGAFLELTDWDDSLAYTSREYNQMRDPFRDRNQRPLSLGFRQFYARGHKQSKKHKLYMEKWQRCLFASPYESPDELNPMSMAYDKRAVAVVHEFLSLTLEKFGNVEFLELVREHYQLPSKVMLFLYSHYGVFYVTFKYDKYIVFLKEAYRARDDPSKLAHLIEKVPQLEMNEQFGKLMDARVSRTPGIPKMDSED